MKNKIFVVNVLIRKYGSIIKKEYFSKLKPQTIYNFGSKKDNSTWYKEHVSDEYVKKATEAGYRSRAAFKLTEIDDRYSVIEGNKNILDLGCAPGSWLQVLSKRADKNSRILGVDKENMKVPSVDSKNKISFLQADITDKSTLVKIAEFFDCTKIDIIVSDIAPSTVGDNDYDGHEIALLNQATYNIAESLLKRNGTMIVKTFRSPYEQGIFQFFNVHFKNVIRIKPSSSRSRSPEMFYLCRNFQETLFWERVREKGRNISFAELKEIVQSSIGLQLNEKEMFEDLLASMVVSGKTIDHEKDNRFLFENEILNGVKSVIPKAKLESEEIENMSPEEYLNSVDQIYDVAVKSGLVKDLPKNTSECIQRYEAHMTETATEIASLRGQKVSDFELIDLDKELNKKSSDIHEQEDQTDENDLKSDFKYEWENGYDDYMLESFKEVVIKPSVKDKKYSLGKEIKEDLHDFKSMTQIARNVEINKNNNKIFEINDQDEEEFNIINFSKNQNSNLKKTIEKFKNANDDISSFDQEVKEAYDKDRQEFIKNEKFDPDSYDKVFKLEIIKNEKSVKSQEKYKESQLKYKQINKNKRSKKINFDKPKN